jgi:hypothetical protein
MAVGRNGNESERYSNGTAVDVQAERVNVLTGACGRNRSQFGVCFTFILPRCIAGDVFLNNQPDVLITQILFCYKTLHVSGIFCTHHQEFFTVHSALVSFMTASKQSQDGTALLL